jgi:Family of unknown function (DUF5995)
MPADFRAYLLAAERYSYASTSRTVRRIARRAGTDMLARVQARIKHRYLTGWLKRLDGLLHRFHRLGDVLAMWDIRRARATAWVNGEALWALRGEAQLGTEFLLALDRMTGLGTRGLLSPADTTFNSMDRRLRRMRRDPLWWA